MSRTQEVEAAMQRTMAEIKEAFYGTHPTQSEIDRRTLAAEVERLEAVAKQATDVLVPLANKSGEWKQRAETAEALVKELEAEVANFQSRNHAH